MLIVYSIIGFLGLIFGELFRRKFKEEVSGKWFSLIRDVILLIILLILIFKFNFYLIIGALAGFLIYYLIKNVYFYLGFVFLFGFNEVVGLLSGLIFMFGLFNKFRIKYLLYFLPLVLLFFKFNSGLVSGFIIGGILNYVGCYKRNKK